MRAASGDRTATTRSSPLALIFGFSFFDADGWDGTAMGVGGAAPREACHRFGERPMPTLKVSGHCAHVKSSLLVWSRTPAIGPRRQRVANSLNAS
jgi:hypothetical protein